MNTLRPKKNGSPHAKASGLDVKGAAASLKAQLLELAKVLALAILNDTVPAAPLEPSVVAV
jgi:hypothetical protein